MATVTEYNFTVPAPGEYHVVSGGARPHPTSECGPHCDPGDGLPKSTITIVELDTVPALAIRCAHCGKTGIALRGGINGARVCHTLWKDGAPLAEQDDCYRLVTVYGEPLGLRIPAGVTDGDDA